ncbi:unnamed protein product [Musa banksii]
MERQGCCWRSPYSPPGVVLGPRPSMAEKGGKGSRLSMNCEAAEILQEMQQHMAVLSMDPKIKLPRNYILSFSKALQYSKINGHCTNVQTLKLNGVAEAEICMIGNICPETVDEVYALIPSLKVNKYKNEGSITEVLPSLATFRASK